MHIVFNNKIEQKNTEIDKVINNLFRLVYNNNACMGRKLLIRIHNPVQLQPINSRSLLTSPNIIPRYKIISISTSVCT